MLMILYQFIFYAYLIMFHIVEKCVESVALCYSVQYNSGLIGSPTIYNSTSMVGSCVSMYVSVSVYLLVHCSAEMSFNLVSSASFINLLPNVS